VKTEPFLFFRFSERVYIAIFHRHGTGEFADEYQYLVLSHGKAILWSMSGSAVLRVIENVLLL
jgi:hypothetical protein